MEETRTETLRKSRPLWRSQGGLLLTSSMAKPVSVLPRLRLFTGGPECSLCTTFKQRLDVVRTKVNPTDAGRRLELKLTRSLSFPLVIQVPFELELYNIRKIEEDQAAAKERKKWRRLYMYDIPVSRSHLLVSSLTPALTLSSLSSSVQVLHLEGQGQIMKHRIDEHQLESLLKAWKPVQAQAEDTDNESGSV